MTFSVCEMVICTGMISSNAFFLDVLLLNLLSDHILSVVNLQYIEWIIFTKSIQYDLTVHFPVISDVVVFPMHVIVPLGFESVIRIN